MTPNLGDYVLATKYGDGDPGDEWAVGFYAGTIPGRDDRHLVVGNDGRSIKPNGYRRVGALRPEVGQWLLSVADALERAPAGSVNLWLMLTPWARGEGEDR